MTKPKRHPQPLVQILPEEIGRALQQAWMNHDRDEIERITIAAQAAHPEFWRDESDGKFPELRKVAPK